MHPWTKAARDLYSKDDLDVLFSIQKQMRQKAFLSFVNRTGPLPTSMLAAGELLSES